MPPISAPRCGACRDSLHRAAPPRSQQHGPRSADETVIAMTLTTQWMLETGRRLSEYPLLHDLAADELRDFWADDHAGGVSPALTSKGNECPLSPAPSPAISGRVTGACSPPTSPRSAAVTRASGSLPGRCCTG